MSRVCALSHFCIVSWCLAATLVGAQTVQRAPIASDRVGEERFFKSDGVTLRYLTAGAGAPVILLHGWSASAEMWQGLMQNLSRDHQVFALDCRGHGRSDKPHDPAQYGIAMVNDVLHLMDTLRVKQAHIIGYSMGGSIALKMLETHPERFLSAVIGGSTGFRPGQDLWDSTLVNDLAHGMPLSEAMIANRPSSMPEPSQAQRDMMRQMDAAQDSRALAAQRRGNSGLFITDELFKTNRVPVLVIYGSLDSPERFVPLKAIFANATFVEVNGAGHGSTPDSPAFLAAVRDFLARH